MTNLQNFVIDCYFNMAERQYLNEGSRILFDARTNLIECWIIKNGKENKS